VTVERFRQEREQDWRALEAALAAARGRPDRLGADGALRLGRLYRSAAADLAFARRRFPADALTQRLEALVVRARVVVYADAGGARHSLRAFLSRGAWQAIAERPGVLAISAGVLGGFALLGVLWGATDPAAAAGLVPGGFIDGAAPPQGDAGLTSEQSAAFSSQLFTHNLQVGFLAFAAGLTFGAGTIALLAFNGAVLGAVLGIALDSGHLDDVARLVVGHGLIELSATVVEAAAGLRIGLALAAPGPHPRSVALVRESRRAVAMLLAAVPWTVLAGFLEAWVSPAGLPGPVVAAVGLAVAATFWALVWWRGRAPVRPPMPAPAPSR